MAVSRHRHHSSLWGGCSMVSSPHLPQHYSTHYRVPLSRRAWYVLLQMILILRVHCLYLINSLWLLVEILEGTTLDPFEQIFIQRLLPPWQFTRVFLGERIKGDLVWEATLAKGRKTTNSEKNFTFSRSLRLAGNTGCTNPSSGLVMWWEKEIGRAQVWKCASQLSWWPLWYGLGQAL